MALNAKQVEAAKPAAKLVKLSDGHGLQLWIMPTGGRHWRLAYRFGGKQKLLALGSYPAIGLAEAREKAATHRKVLADGVDPAVLRKIARENTFDVMADEYLASMAQDGRSQLTIDKNRWLLAFARPTLGPRPIEKISAAEVLAVLKTIDEGGRRESARRARAIIGAVFRHAIMTQRAEVDPTLALRGTFKAADVRHRAAIIDRVAFGGLLRAIHGFEGQRTTKAALELCALLAPRPGEIRLAEWGEFDLDAAVWTVPAGRMKMRKPHATPLSRQAVDVLRELREITGGGRLVFPGARSPDRAISDGTLNAALRRLGYAKEEATSHGFRASFASLANEAGLWNPDAIERQLAHTDDDGVRKAYARGAYWDERVRLVQWWADECDAMREGGKVVELRTAG